MIRLLPVLVLLACTREGEDPPDTTVPAVQGHPRLLVTADRRELVLSRLDRDPYDAILARIVVRADEDWSAPDPQVWDHHAHGRNGEIAQANALLAWLFDDEDRAIRAREGMALLTPDLETTTTWDVNIRMPHPIMGYANAWDLLAGTPWFPDEEAEAARAALTDLNRAFFSMFIESDFTRNLVLGTAQNNHPIRTATAIGYVGLLFPDDRHADRWLSWALSELDYLWGPDGQYVMADGGVSEGPFYYGFAYGVTVAFAIAADHVLAADRTFPRDCRNRSDVPPWAGHGCVDGEPFVFRNPLHDPGFHATADWSVNLRLPSGLRAPLADGYLNPFNGGSLLGPFTGHGYYRWDWEHTEGRPREMHHGADLTAHHLVWLDDTLPMEPPPWTNRFLPDAGNAVFRSDWTDEARWLLLVAEHGSARKTLHDHVDSTSFSLAAYGDYLLVDPGYYKPNDLDNAVTAQADAHNVILIDGQGAPNKGLLTNFGDADAWLRHTLDGEVVAYAEAHQTYRDTDIERSVVFVDGRYFVVADRLATRSAAPRTHAWRLGGNAGYDVGGTFTLRGDGAGWARERGAVEVYLASTADGLQIAEPAFQEHARPHVGQFDLTRAVAHHAVIDGTVDALAPGFLAVLAPHAVGAAPGADDGPLDVQALDLGEGIAAWEITTADAVDIVILREPDAAGALALPDGLLETDAELVVVRRAGPRPFALIARGTELRLDGDLRAGGADPVVLVE